MENKPVKKHKKTWILIAAGILSAAVLLLYLVFGKKRDTLPDGSGEEIFKDLAAGAEQIQEWSGDINSELLTLDLGSIQEVQYFRIRWDRSAVSGIKSWTIVAWQEEMSKIYPDKSSGEGALVLYQSDQTPYLEEETICLPVLTPVRTLRILVEGAETAPEVSVYAQNPWERVFAVLDPHFEDGQLVTAPMPSWLEVDYAGCRPSAILGADGKMQSMAEAKTVHVGYTMDYKGWRMESPDYLLVADPYKDADLGTISGEPNPKPAVIPELQEWRGFDGEVTVSEETVILTDPELEGQARILAADVQDVTGWEWEIRTEGEPGEGFVVIKKSDKDGLGDEGYLMSLYDTIELSAYTEKGIYWGGRTFLQMLFLYAEKEEDAAKQPDLIESSIVLRYPKRRIAAEKVALPRGTMRDYPSYPVRGFEIDAARNSVSLHMLREMAKTLSWYKCNELTVHLNDNAILAYTEKRDSWDTVYDIYSAYRLESNLTGTDGKSITAKDMFYSKDDFSAFVQEAASYGVRIVPEIDTPAHALAITSAYPELALPKKEAADMLDLSKEESTELIKRLWDDALPAFADCPVVHLGGDEYYGEPQEYIDYENTMTEYLAQQGKSTRLWGSLSKIRGNRFLTSEYSTDLIIWNTDWADPETMYQEGFGLINAWNKELYLIPGGGYDYLDREKLYTTFRPNVFYKEDGSGSTELPAYSGRIRGAQICMWNDLCDELAIGITEYDMFDRLYHALPAFSCRCWNTDGTMEYDTLKQSAEVIGEAPASDPYDHGISYNGAGFIGPPYRITLKMERFHNEERSDPEWDGIIKLGDQEREGNPYVFYLSNANRHVGIACEEYEDEWDYEIPEDRPFTLTIEGNKDTISLYADGEPVGTLGSSEPFTDHRTFLFPTERLASAFNPTRDAWPPCMILSSGEMLELKEMHIE